MGNYMMINSHISPEEMLHLLSSPPELYVQDEGMTNIVNTEANVDNKQINVNLINNCINRILTAEENSLTYQDRTFIENILYNSGIKDVQEFINLLSLMKEEVTERNEIKNLYESHEEFIDYVNNVKNAANSSLQNTFLDNSRDYGEELWLHQSVLNRLDTAEIYESVINFIRPQHLLDNYVTQNELSLLEQKNFSDSLLLSQYENVDRKVKHALQFTYYNTYEQGELKEDTTEDSVRSEIVSANLVNIIKNLYNSRYSDIYNKTASWFDISEGIHTAIENTISRYGNVSIDTEYINQINQENNRIWNQYSKADIQNRFNAGDSRNTNVLQNNNYVSRSDDNSINYHDDRDVDLSYRYDETQQILNELEIINQQNFQRQERLKKLSEDARATEAPKRRISMEQARKDALRALNDPEEVLREYLETAERTEVNKSVEERLLSQVVDADTLNILNLVRQYEEGNTNIEGINVNGDLVFNQLLAEVQENQNYRKEVISNIENNYERLLSEQAGTDRERVVERVHSYEAGKPLQQEINISQADIVNIENLSEEDITNRVNQITNQLLDRSQPVDVVNNETIRKEVIRELVSKEEKTQAETLHLQLLQTIDTSQNLHSVESQILEIYKTEAPLINQLLLEGKRNETYRQEVISRIENNQERLKSGQPGLDRESVIERVRFLEENRPPQQELNISQADMVNIEYHTEEEITDRVNQITNHLFDRGQQLDEVNNETLLNLPKNKRSIEKVQTLEGPVREIIENIRKKRTDLIIRQYEDGESQIFRELSKLPLTHKVMERQIDEETIEELTNLTRHNTIQLNNIQEINESHRTVTETRVNTVENHQIISREDVADMVRENVSRQLDNVSERVIRQLERRMDSEKRRRGM